MLGQTSYIFTHTSYNIKCFLKNKPSELVSKRNNFTTNKPVMKIESYVR